MLSQRWNNRGRITALKTFLYTKEFVLLDSTCASNLLSHLTWHSEMDVKKKKVLLWFFFIPQYWSKDQQFLRRDQYIVFQQRSVERIFMEDFMMTTRVDIDEHASLLHRSSYYLPLPQEDRQNKRSIKPWAVGFALLLLSCWRPMCVHDSQCKLFQRQFHRLFLWERRGVFIFRRTGDNMACYTLCFHNHHHLGTAESSRFSWL